MKIADYIKNEYKKVAEKPLRERWEYFWEYYKWPVLAVVLAVVLLVQGIAGVVNKKDIVFSGFVLNSRLVPDDSEFLQGFYDYAGIDSGSQETAFYCDITLNDGNSKNDITAFQRIMAGIATKEADFVVGQAVPFRLCAYNTGKIFLDLREFFDEETLALFADRLYYIDGAVLTILDAPLGEQMDMSAVEYPDPTKPDDMEDPIPVGIDISSCEAFRSAYYLTDASLYLGVIANTPRTELALQLIEYLFRQTETVRVQDNTHCFLYFYTGNPHLLAMELFIAEDKVCPFSGSDRANFLLAAQSLGRIPRGSQNRFLLGYTKLYRIKHSVIQICDRTGNGPVGQLGNTALQINCLTAQLVFSVRHTAAPQGIGYQADSAGKQSECHSYSAGMHMYAVANQFRLHIFIFRGCADNTGFSMVNGRHGIKQVGHMGCARLNHSLCLLIGGICVGNGNSAKLRCLPGKLRSIGQFRGQVHNPNQSAAAVIQLLKGRKIRIFQVRAILRAFFLQREKGSLHLDAHDPGAAGRLFIPQFCACGKSLFQRRIGQCHRRRRKGGNAVFCQITGDGHQSFIVPVGKIRIGVAVIMHINQTGNHIGVFQVNALFLRNTF